MAIDMASVYAAKYRKQPDMLRAAVMGQSPDASLDSYTALNALRLIKEADMMAMAGQAQQPTSAPSIVAQNLAPPPMMQGLGAMVPGAMGQAPQGMPPQQRAPMPQPTMQAASGGLAGMYTPEEDFAEGGIVAFQVGGPAYAGSSDGAVAFAGSSGDAATDDPLSRLLAEVGVAEPVATDDTVGGSPAMRDEAFRNYLESRGVIKGIKDDDFTPEEAKRMRQETFDFYEKNAGPNIYDPANRRLSEREAARSKNTSQGQGLALLAAAGAILEGNTLARGASKAFPVFAKEMGEVQRADINEQRSIEQMQFALADAQRKERMGNIRGAQAAMETARKERADANRFKLNKAVALSTLDAKALQSLRPTGKAAGSGDGASSKDFIVGPETYLAQIKEEHPEWSPAKQKAEAFKLFQQGKSAGLQGAVIKADTATAQLTAKQNSAVMKQMDIWEGGIEKRKAVLDGTIDTVRAAKKEALRKDALRGVFDTDGEETPSAAPVAAPTTKPGTRLKFNAAGEQIK